jgi:hypothetical protein
MSIETVKNALAGTPLWRLYDISSDNPEHYLYDSFINEFTDVVGFEIDIYFPIVSWDKLYGEDPNTNLSNAITTKLIYEPTEETSILESFGITSDETLQYAVIPKTMFARDCTDTFLSIPSLSAGNLHPIPGMVIHTKWNNRKYEVVNVGAEQQIFQAKKLIWELILRPFRYSSESLEAYRLHKLDPTATLTATSSAADGTPIYDELLEYGDNEYIEEESDAIDDYSSIDEKIFGR